MSKTKLSNNNVELNTCGIKLNWMKKTRKLKICFNSHQEHEKKILEMKVEGSKNRGNVRGKV